ncbi:MAG TPA: SdrD B-like domain-containing protein [Vicinamibacterales bacterium]|nr:SdrD B-like domain-containing protein [Vicinamibacterales bacterium]
MSQENNSAELREQTQQLLDGPLKHIRAAALAAALLPLASVVATPASAQTGCIASAGVCGVVFNDVNNNGIQDAGEPGLEGVQVYVTNGSETTNVQTGPDGSFAVVDASGPTTISVLIPVGTQASPSNVGGNDTVDSDGVPNGSGFSVAVVNANGLATDFGFHSTAAPNPGTGTPGYWKNHPDAWPVQSITVGGRTYTKAEAIAWLGKVGKDKTTTMFSSLVPAMLNLMIGNDGSCVSAAIAAGNAWMATYGPVGSGVAGGSYAWSVGEPTHITLDNYNNGRLCAPHRQ